MTKKEKATKVIRHGDVSLHAVDDLPQNAKIVLAGKDWQNDGFVLAYGETTGHTHKLSADTSTLRGFTADFEIYETSDGERYVLVTSSAKLSHEEHKTLEIPKGLYVQKQEREEDPFSEDIAENRVRRVID